MSFCWLSTCFSLDIRALTITKQICWSVRHKHSPRKRNSYRVWNLLVHRVNFYLSALKQYSKLVYKMPIWQRYQLNLRYVRTSDITDIKSGTTCLEAASLNALAQMRFESSVSLSTATCSRQLPSKTETKHWKWPIRNAPFRQQFQASYKYCSTLYTSLDLEFQQFF